MAHTSKFFKKDGTLKAIYKAEHVAHALLAVDYPGDVTVSRLLEILDESKHGLQHCTVNTLEIAIRRAARELGREVAVDRFGDEIVEAAQTRKEV